MLESGVGRQDTVVRLHDGAGRLRSGVDTELELRLLAILGRKAVEKKSTLKKSRMLSWTNPDSRMGG